MAYFEHVAAIALIYAMLASSLDLVVGHAGMFSAAHAAFWGIGAYATALLSMQDGLSFIASMIAGIAAAALLAAVISIPMLRLNDEYFLIGTFAFQVITTGLMMNWTDLTRGPLGIHAIPQPFGWNPHRYVALVAVAATLTLIFISRLVRSPYGRLLHAVREDEILCRALGKRIVKLKVSVFAVAAAIAASAGALFAWYVTYLEPANFTITDSILMISMIIIGGVGTRFGPCIGAVLLIFLPESLRFAGLPAATAANLRQMLYAVAMIVALIIRPRGLLGRREMAR